MAKKEKVYSPSSLVNDYLVEVMMKYIRDYNDDLKKKD